jgi:hypothetical protein
MGDPHNPERYGETWDPIRWKVLANEIEAVKEYGALSGGWAWHYMSPPIDRDLLVKLLQAFMESEAARASQVARRDQRLNPRTWRR